MGAGRSLLTDARVTSTGLATVQLGNDSWTRLTVARVTLRTVLNFCGTSRGCTFVPAVRCPLRQSLTAFADDLDSAACAGMTHSAVVPAKAGTQCDRT